MLLGPRAMSVDLERQAKSPCTEGVCNDRIDRRKLHEIDMVDEVDVEKTNGSNRNARNFLTYAISEVQSEKLRRR